MIWQQWLLLGGQFALLVTGDDSADLMGDASFCKGLMVSILKYAELLSMGALLWKKAL